MTIEVTDGATPLDIAHKLRFMSDVFLGMPSKAAAAVKLKAYSDKAAVEAEEPEADDEKEVVEAKPKKTAAKVTALPATKKKAAPVEDDEEFDLDEEASDDVPPISQDDIIAGFKEFAKENGRDAAGEILKKLKVKNVREIKEASYEKVMKLLQA